MNEITTKQSNPFSNAPVAASPTGANAVAQTESNRAIAEVQAAMMIARMNPRDQISAMDRILNACSRASLADAAVYQYSRGGADISGPSIRLAEAIAQNWGNLQFGIRELDQRNGESTVQAFAWDVETNTRREVTFQIPHKRYTRKGSYMLEDPRDIYEMVANQGARRLRACILAVVPGDVTEAAVNQCELTMKAKADTSPDAIKKMIEAFAAFGVSKEQIEKRIQRRLDSISPAQIVSLKKIYSSLRDGMSIPVDWFEPTETPAYDPEKKKGVDALKEKLRTENSNGQEPSQPETNPTQPAAAEQKEQLEPAASQTEKQEVNPEAPAEERLADPQHVETNPGPSARVKTFMKEINKVSEGGSLAVDTWRAKHHNRVANACGGESSPDFFAVMDYADMTYRACVDSEAEQKKTGGAQNGLF